MDDSTFCMDDSIFEIADEPGALIDRNQSKRPQKKKSANSGGGQFFPCVPWAPLRQGFA
jgi:hypothetical protein